ncbi:MAG: peptidoglycan-binding protein [Ilumatobacteraceae bacterium]
MTLGQRGDAVRDLQRRLAAAGFTTVGDEPGMFGPSTQQVLSAFQQQRGLHVSGTCDEPTWLALVEAGWTLGDRLLLLGAPQLRGDDVAQLQAALNHLGFDCGRPDGIMGPATARALEDFQRNSGLTADGVCGSHTVRMLELVSRQSGSGPGVAVVRESESMATHASLRTLRVVIGQFGGLSSISRSLSRALRDGGATVMSTDEYEAGAQAAAANRFGASAYIGFEARSDTRSMICYFAVPTFESVGGRTLASRAVDELRSVLAAPPELHGMRLPVLRETRMPAVLCSLGPVRAVVDATDEITERLVTAIDAWATSPMTDRHPPARS